MTGNADPRFTEALAFAAQAHGAVEQARKGSRFPYVSHPIRVAEILARFDCGDDVVVAGFLHDTIEDTRVTVEEITASFGARVAALVTAASEPDKAAEWKDRKQHTIDHLREERDSDVLALVAADKLDNVRATTDMVRHLGAATTWGLFNAPQSEQHWYFRSIAEILLDKDPESRLFRTLDFETQTLYPDRGHATTFFAGKPLGTPHDARAYLADPIRHWRPDHSALELATIWIDAGAIPQSVADVLATSSTYAGCRLIEGLFEREVELGTKGRPSQTDLLALVELRDGYGVIAVEGKAREPFGPLVGEWNDSPGKQTRLDSLCEQLGLGASGVGGLRYQLLHRTVSALREAHRYGAHEALMLVHSFDPSSSSFTDYQAFAAALGMTDAGENSITTSIARGDVTLRLGWVKQR
jgi:HD domain